MPAAVACKQDEVTMPFSPRNEAVAPGPKFACGARLASGSAASIGAAVGCGLWPALGGLNRKQIKIRAMFHTVRVPISVFGKWDFIVDFSGSGVDLAINSFTRSFVNIDQGVNLRWTRTLVALAFHRESP